MITRKRSRRNRKHVSTLPLAIVGLLVAVMFAYPVVAVVIASIVAASVIGAFLGIVLYVIGLARGTFKPPARIIRDKKAQKWSVEFL